MRNLARLSLVAAAAAITLASGAACRRKPVPAEQTLASPSPVPSPVAVPEAVPSPPAGEVERAWEGLRVESPTPPPEVASPTPAPSVRPHPKQSGPTPLPY